MKRNAMMTGLVTITMILLAAFTGSASQELVHGEGYWAPGQDSFQFNSNGRYLTPAGEQPLDTNSEKSKEITFTAKPDAGWAVDGWYQSFQDFDPRTGGAKGELISGTGGLLQYTQGWVSTSKLFIAVKFKYISYDLEYNGNGGSNPGKQIGILYTDEYALADAPDFTGHTFLGWQDVAGVAHVASSTVSGKDFSELDDVHVDGHVVKLTALWATNTYTVTFDPNGGSVTPASKVVTYGQPYGDLPTPQREGSAFAGWYAGDRLVTAETVMLTAANHTLTAKWDEKVTVTFHWKNADGTSASDTQSVVKGGSATPPSNLPQRIGYDFVRWDGNYTNVQANTDVNAVYEQWQFLVEFFTDGDGSGTVLPISMEYGYGEVLKVIATADESSEFAGWDDGVQESNRIVTVIAPTNYTATFTLKRFDVTFNWKTGANVETQEVRTVVWGDTVPPEEVPDADTCTGYTFKAWDADFSSVKSNLTVNATYEPHNFKVSYDLSGVETNYVWTAKNPQDFIYDVPQKLLFPPSCQSTDGFAFWAWECNGEIYEMPTEAGDVMVSNLTAEADGVVTMKAVWDVGPLSRAMKCDNLYWRAATDPGWKPGEEAAVREGNQYQADMLATIKTNGVISFDWKVEGLGEKRMYLDYYYETNGDLERCDEIWGDDVLEGGWHHTDVRVDIPWPDPTQRKITKLCIGLLLGDNVCVTAFVRNVTWTPDGANPDPKPGDAVTISSAEISGNTFKLSFTSDAKFDYNLLTNANLLIDSWGVMTNKPGTGATVTFEPEILPGVSQMFYKVETIRKK